jgi:hypothetical protein
MDLFLRNTSIILFLATIGCHSTVVIQNLPVKHQELTPPKPISANGSQLLGKWRLNTSSLPAFYSDFYYKHTTVIQFAKDGSMHAEIRIPSLKASTMASYDYKLDNDFLSLRLLSAQLISWPNAEKKYRNEVALEQDNWPVIRDFREESGYITQSGRNSFTMTVIRPGNSIQITHLPDQQTDIYERTP